jgi:formate hydrogenlyase subunit 3/multisubunit Na+/H+ antiporter MnhD subunit
VAYSTVAQVGYLFLVFSLTADPSAAWRAWSGTVYFAMSHACAKAAAFMAAGSLRYATGSDNIDELSGTARQQPLSVFAFGLAGVGLMGLPPSGTFLGKWLLLNAALASGRWILAIVILSGGILAAIYVFRVVAKTFRSVEPARTLRVPVVMQWPPLLLALLSIGLGVVAVQSMALLEIGAPFSSAMSGETP